MVKDKKSRAETVAFVAKLLKADKDMPFSDMKKQGSAAGLNVYPLIVGLARKALGWKPAGRRTAAKKVGRPAKAASAVAPMKRGRGRPPKVAVAGGSANALDSIVREFEAMRGALRDIAAIAARF